MYIYQVIISIIEQFGPCTIPNICHEINQHVSYMNNRIEPVQQSQIKSVINRKKDLFYINDNYVSILPEKQFHLLVVDIGEDKTPLFRIKVDFLRELFFIMEVKTGQSEKIENIPFVPGSIDEFKQELYSLKIWEWDTNYENEGIVLGGINWKIQLHTATKVYKSEGLQSFPKNWRKFCKALSMLTGKQIINHYEK